MEGKPFQVDAVSCFLEKAESLPSIAGKGFVAGVWLFPFEHQQGVAVSRASGSVVCLWQQIFDQGKQNAIFRPLRLIFFPQPPGVAYHLLRPSAAANLGSAFPLLPGLREVPGTVFSSCSLALLYIKAFICTS